MRARFCVVLVFVVAASAFADATTPRASAVELALDFTYDASDFFGVGNPDGATAGAQARAALEAAADFYSDILEDTFSAIETPEVFNSSSPFGGSVTWAWNASFFNPGTGLQVSVQDPIIAADEVRVYAGGRALGGNTLGRGGPGGYGVSSSPSGGFTQSEINQIDAITADFFNAVEQREESDGFATWGGAITFDSDGSTDWHYDHTTSPTAGKDDFYSVALHELGHVLGLGSSDEWVDWINTSGRFNGPASIAANGGIAPEADDDHWEEGTLSTTYDGFTQQETLLDPTIFTGSRKVLTKLDAAALDDIGWEVADPGLITGDYNFDGQITAADYTLWRDSVGSGAVVGSYAGWKAAFIAANGVAAGSVSGSTVPEPTSLVVVGLLAGCCGSVRRR